jgi:hypothetical protein
MTVKRKSLALSKQPTVSDVINRGGKTTLESKSEIIEDGEVRFTLRIPKKLIEGIDKSRKSRVGNISRNQWILEAIAEKLP